MTYMIDKASLTAMVKDPEHYHVVERKRGAHPLRSKVILDPEQYIEWSMVIRRGRGFARVKYLVDADGHPLCDPFFHIEGDLIECAAVFPVNRPQTHYLEQDEYDRLEQQHELMCPWHWLTTTQVLRYAKGCAERGLIPGGFDFDSDIDEAKKQLTAAHHMDFSGKVSG